MNEVEEVLDNYGLPRPEHPRGRDIPQDEVEFLESDSLPETVTNVLRDIDQFQSAIVEVPGISSAQESEIGDADYVIDVETTPSYSIPSREVFEAAVEALQQESHNIDPMNTEEVTAHIDEILEEVPDEEEPFVIDSEAQAAIDAIMEEMEVPEVQTSIQQLGQVIVPNSQTILISETTSRFSGAEWYNQIQREKVILAGVGGIGSYIGFLLGRLNIDKLTIFDDDVVDTVNLSGQLYSIENVGQKKVDALSSMIINYANFYKISAQGRKYDELSPSGPVMICGFDNMVARNVFFNSWLTYVNNHEEDKHNCLFIDGRLAAEEYQILCLRGDDEYSINKYKEEFLFTDAQADATLCSYKQTSFMANQIASNMVNLFVNFVANKCEPIIERYLPFYTEYNAETMFFKTIS